MTNQERDKAIWEGLGHKWRECQECEEHPDDGMCSLMLINSCRFNPDFSSDAGKVLLLREMMKLEDWQEFVNHLIKDGEAYGIGDALLMALLITDSSGKFADAVYDWLTCQK
jgi:hypothetical protein